MKNALLCSAVSSAAIAMSLVGGAAHAEPQREPRPAVGVAVPPGEVTAEEMVRRWGGDTKSGVTTDGPEVDKRSIAAPVVQPGYKVPRLSGGRPDLTGTWSNASNTSLMRPRNMPNLVMTDAKAREARQNNPQNIRQATDDKQSDTTAFDGKDLASGRGYNAGWIDPGTNYALVKGTWRTSWIVEPASGQLPLKPGVSQRPAPLGNGYDNPEERNVSERCIIFPTSGPPIGNFLYNNNVQIVQSRDSVAIVSEMAHDTRIIPLNAKHVATVLAPWMGDSIGWYDGDTLVVETINIQRPGATIPISPAAKITERFSRYNKDQVFYEFEVNDPTTYTQVLKGQMSLNRSPQIYEYACHEGNYGLEGILAGGRANDVLGKRNGGVNDRSE